MTQIGSTSECVVIRLPPLTRAFSLVVFRTQVVQMLIIFKLLLLQAAAVARHVYLRKHVGVGRMQKVHGGAANRGQRPSRHVDASGGFPRILADSIQTPVLRESRVHI